VPPFRVTTAVRAVLQILLEDPGRSHYGLEICDKAGYQSGTVYPVLARLEKCGWLESYWEQDPAVRDGSRAALARPRRRYYRFSADGAAAARNLLAASPQPWNATRWHRPAEGEAS
jgi:DNA-binding PadR family transcriptional regulator